jgi:hypothetical protein
MGSKSAALASLEASRRADDFTAGAERPLVAQIWALSGNLGMKALCREGSVEIEAPE